MRWFVMPRRLRATWIADEDDQKHPARAQIEVLFVDNRTTGDSRYELCALYARPDGANEQGRFEATLTHVGEESSEVLASMKSDPLLPNGSQFVCVVFDVVVELGDLFLCEFRLKGMARLDNGQAFSVKALLSKLD